MKRVSKILFVTAADVDDTAALEQAIKLAENNQAQVTVVRVVDQSANAQVQEALVAEASEQVQRALQNVSPKQDVETNVLVGREFIEIIRAVLRDKYDMVIKSLVRGDSKPMNLFGGTDKNLLRKCPCPVWLIQSAHPRKILVALDIEPDNPENAPLNYELLETAASLALSEFAELHVIHAWQFEHESLYRSPRLGFTQNEVDNMVENEERQRKKWLDELVEKCLGVQGKEASAYIEAQLHVVKGRARDVVPEIATKIDADLVVMGTIGRTGIPGFTIGNTAEEILNQITCSILAVKPEAFVSSVTAEAGNEG